MTELRFEGALDASGHDAWATTPEIAGRKVIDEIEATFPDSANLRVYLGVEGNPPAVAEGPSFVEHGWGGTDVTPGDPYEIKVGDRSLVSEIYRLDGETVVLVIEDV